MAIYTISDLHLSFSTNKPMEIFGGIWANYENKIQDNWKSTVTENDYVILPGDHSWALHTEDATKDLEFIHNLPGKKILIKGNHDLWWTTSKKMNEFKEANNFNSIYFFYNDCLIIESDHKAHIIAGTRGWLCPGDSEFKASTDEKIYVREAGRLLSSLQKAKISLNKIPEEKQGNIYVFMHYPPYNTNKETLFTKHIEAFNATSCYYGHIHGVSQKDASRTNIKFNPNGTSYTLVSCDYTNYQLVKVAD